jgi:hypothetical protein
MWQQSVMWLQAPLHPGSSSLPRHVPLMVVLLVAAETVWSLVCKLSSSSSNKVHVVV